MGEILEEVKLWNTPAVGAFLLHKFTASYQSNHASGDSPVALLHFIVTSILTSEKLKEPITNRRENLQSYVRSFEDHKQSDLLLGIHERVKNKLEYTWRSIDIGVASGLLYWDYESGRLYSKNITVPPTRGVSPKGLVKKDGEKAEILGKWFSQHDVSTITAYLKIIL